MAKAVKAESKKKTSKSSTNKKLSNSKSTKTKAVETKSKKSTKSSNQKKDVKAKTVERKAIKQATTVSKSDKSKNVKKSPSEQTKVGLLPKNSMKKMPSESAKPAVIATPSDQMLKPFREAAKRTQMLIKEKQKATKKSSFLAKPLKSAKKIYMDLRVHTPASEGFLTTGGIDPASAMVRLAKAKGLDMIAVTDYHSAEFVDVIKSKAENTTVKVIPGLDLRCSVGTCDEVTLVALFPENYSKEDLDKILDKLEIPRNKRGLQSYTISLELERIIKLIEEDGGIIIPSRLDITPHRMTALRELVENHGFHVFDLAHPDNPEYFKENWPDGEFTFLSFSNANALGQIGARSAATRLADGGFNGIKSLVNRRNNSDRA